MKRKIDTIIPRNVKKRKISNAINNTVENDTNIDLFERIEKQREDFENLQKNFNENFIAIKNVNTNLEKENKDLRDDLGKIKQKNFILEKKIKELNFQRSKVGENESIFRQQNLLYEKRYQEVKLNLIEEQKKNLTIENEMKNLKEKGNLSEFENKFLKVFQTLLMVISKNNVKVLQKGVNKNFVETEKIPYINERNILNVLICECKGKENAIRFTITMKKKQNVDEGEDEYNVVYTPIGYKTEESGQFRNIFVTNNQRDVEMKKTISEILNKFIEFEFNFLEEFLVRMNKFLK